MRSTQYWLVFCLSLLFTIISSPQTARADNDDSGDEYDVSARVVRISLTNGDVSLKRHDSDDWQTARLNTPLVEGDILTTAKEAQAEIQIDGRNFLRLASDSVLRIVALRSEGIALSLGQGTATLRLAQFDKDHEYFEIDAPKTTIAAESKGVYRLDARSNGDVRLTVRDGGKARVYSDSAGFTVKNGHSATLSFVRDEAGDWQLDNAAGNDSWDDWVKDREKYLASRLRYDQNARFYDADIWGTEDLDAYGNWSYVDDYGWMWRPNLTIINNYIDYNEWAPYRFGSWVWCSPYGWTWVGDEPWAWAPYHFGRWVYYNNSWAWCPYGYYRRHRSWWRPALVAFLSIDFNFGSSYCWYPLSYHQRDPDSLYYRRNPLTPLRRDELRDLRRVNPAYFRAVTAVATNDFGQQNGRFRAASDELARRAIGTDPLRGGLPVRPTTAAGANGTNRAARPAPANSAATIARPTGAATRTPGVALDNELRRSRIFNGREPVTTRSINNAARAPEATPSGAVTRPARTGGPPVNSGGDFRAPVPNEDSGGRTTPPRREDRPTRPNPNDGGDSRDRNPGPPRERQASPPTTTSRPAQPPERSERPPEPARAAPPDRPSPPAPRSESQPTRSSPPPRSEDRPSRPDPPPQRSEPRSEPPPQRSEPPAQRSEPPPQRSEPSPQRSEPSRSESPKSESSPRKPNEKR